MDGFIQAETGKVVKGYKRICEEILTKFPDPTAIKGRNAKDFVEALGTC